MSKETAGPAETNIPLVAIVSDYRNVTYAVEYEERLLDLGFDTEWIVDADLLREWADTATAAIPGHKAGVVRHPYSYSWAYRTSVEATLKANDFLATARDLISEADVVLGTNRYPYTKIKDPISPFTMDYLAMGVGLGRLSVVSEAFPTVALREDVGSYNHGLFMERGIQLKSLGIRRAQGNMSRVWELYEERLALTKDKGSPT